MPDLIVISGPINSGKTTTSTELARRLPNAAHVKGDELRHFLTQLPLEEAISVTHKVIVAVVKTYLSAGFNVVLDYPLYKPDFEKLREAVAENNARVHAFILAPPLEIAQTNRGERSLSAWELERIAHHYATNLHDPGFGVQLDNAGLSAEEVVEEILERLALVPLKYSDSRTIGLHT